MISSVRWVGSRDKLSAEAGSGHQRSLRKLALLRTKTVLDEALRLPGKTLWTNRMYYIIDGHNLISIIPGLDLRMPDDEQRLIELLILFCQPGKHKVEVYFDQAPIGQAGVTNHGRVRVHFVTERTTADDAIHRRLRSLGKSASTWAVVSSDRSVQAAGREAHAQVLSAEGFASLLQASLLRASLRPNGSSPAPAADEPLSEAEVKEWEAIFKGESKPK
jgi:predicted RNA-binding protein with PIN domain